MSEDTQAEPLFIIVARMLTLSGGEARRLVRTGKVLIDGVIAKNENFPVSPENRVSFFDTLWQENFHANAIQYGALVTRNQSGFALLRLGENGLAALSEKLDVLKMQLQRDIAERLRQFFQSGRGRTLRLTMRSHQSLNEHLSQSLKCHFASLQLSDVSPEILHEWFAEHSSSSPRSISDNARTDSSSEAGIKTGAPFDLSRESLATLYQLAENAQNLELLKAAALELDKRRGCDV